MPAAATSVSMKGMFGRTLSVQFFRFMKGIVGHLCNTKRLRANGLKSLVISEVGR